MSTDVRQRVNDLLEKLNVTWAGLGRALEMNPKTLANHLRNPERCTQELVDRVVSVIVDKYNEGYILVDHLPNRDVSTLEGKQVFLEDLVRFQETHRFTMRSLSLEMGEHKDYISDTLDGRGEGKLDQLLGDIQAYLDDILTQLPREEEVEEEELEETESSCCGGCGGDSYDEDEEDWEEDEDYRDPEEGEVDLTRDPNLPFWKRFLNWFKG